MAAVPTIVSQQDTLALIGPMLNTSGKKYRKFKRAFIRKAEAKEKIQTILDGKLETENVAAEGDLAVRADTSSKEQYILKAETFKEFYCDPQEIDEAHPDCKELRALGFLSYRPKREILAVEVTDEIMTHFPERRFMAAWGEPMCLEVGDFLGSGKAKEDGSIGEIIRIEKKAFHETYEAF